MKTINYTDSNILKIVKLKENAVVPQRSTAGSAGYDLCAAISEPITIEPGVAVVLSTGLAAAFPKGTAGMVFSRSGLGLKHGIHVTNGVGVIDSDYRGEMQIGLHNLSHESYTIFPQERVAQLIIVPVLTLDVEIVESLSETERGSGGLGSTGKI